MKLCTIAVAAPVGVFRRLAVYTPSGYVDATAARIAFLERSLPAAVASRVGEAQVPPDLAVAIGGGRVAMDWIREAVEFVQRAGAEQTALGLTTVYQEKDIALLAPIPRPPGIACFTTWEQHIRAAEARGAAVKWIPPGSEMRVYYKGNPDSVVSTGAPLTCPDYAAELDVEAEFAAIVGTGGKDLTLEEARDSIAGYCIYNDVSVRDIQRREMPLGLGPAKGKDHDGGNVLGPWLVTPDEVGDVRNLEMSLRINGQLVSSHSTAGMAWDHAELMAYLSRGQTIRSGHVLTSGSFPDGCGADLGIKIAAGDSIDIRITNLGALVNTVAKPDSTKARPIK